MPVALKIYQSTIASKHSVISTARNSALITIVISPINDPTFVYRGVEGLSWVRRRIYDPLCIAVRVSQFVI
jgi:hypothetical protein